MSWRSISLAIALCESLVASTVAAAEWSVARGDRQLDLRRDGTVIAIFVTKDDAVRRPYYHSVQTSSGKPVTRHYPPREGIDRTDHPTMHPGLWLAFGELGGVDFWRNKGLVEFVEFTAPPTATADGVSFSARFRYRDGDRIVCEETTRHTWRDTPRGVQLSWDSEFRATAPTAFGDQEEMGLGVRLATPLNVAGGTGQIVNSAGLENEPGVWGKTADWCAYTGVEGDRRIGLALFPHPGNFRPAWFHARNYGLLVANPFGRKAFTKGETSRVEFGPMQPLRLRFGVLIVEAPASSPVDMARAFADYVRD
ncbi:MAG TPA: DUF6807 family protein [Planctomycetaceae bacterium]|nr:DUF6807 family protein [Planctomycetaceae bacterium]